MNFPARSLTILAGLVITTSPVFALPEYTRSAEGIGGMVAAAHPLAVEAGLEMLAKGGNAADAAAAAAFAIAVTEPFGSSIGGDGIALVYSSKEDKVRSYSYRCRAPLAATTTIFDNSKQNEWLYTSLGAAVPGMILGTLTFHEELGLLSRAEVMAPSIRYAAEGFSVGPTLSGVITDFYDLITKSETATAIYLDEGFPPEVGATLRNPDLAKALQYLSDHGAEGFYGGALGQHVVNYLQSTGGVMTLEDLTSYRMDDSEPLSITYRDYKVYSPAPPYGGVAILQGLKLYERFTPDLEEGSHGARNLHLLTEIMKITSADRYEVSGDPRFVSVPTEWLLSDAYIDRRVKDIPLEKASPPRTVNPGPVWEMKNGVGSTTHLTVVDGQGNAVSLTQTLGGFFGCGVVVPGTGIVLNDQMKNFSSRRGSPNSLQPGKSMNSTQSPTIVTRDGELVFAVGSPGNYRILSTVFQMLVYVLDFQLPLQDALDAPRISARNTYDELLMESRIPLETLSALRSMGHPIKLMGEFNLFFGGVHAVVRDPETNTLTGAADRRRDGIAGGLEALASRDGD